ncbi:hypothetical protein QYM36_019520 [Artemia franciscana]|uniref:Reverse transcriptase domain-containing protein n=1 Tax=Artemia franciscana TaxID=6661 RepID=A0AA88H744_ARTSF|nr:hypothetical protein QYM36_019520 [Artemia franciscana]
MTPPSASQILNTIKRLKNNKPSGEDGLPPEVHKASPHVVKQKLETFFKRAVSSFDGVVMGLGINVSDLDYADDINTFTADPATAQAMLNEIAYFSQPLGIKINMAKTKVMDQNIQSDYQLLL